MGSNQKNIKGSQKDDQRYICYRISLKHDEGLLTIKYFEESGINIRIEINYSAPILFNANHRKSNNENLNDTRIPKKVE